jgi:STAM-binding protein
MASAAGSLGPRRGPLAIDEIANEAGNFEYNQNIPLKSWMRTADVIQKQVR